MCVCVRDEGGGGLGGGGQVSLIFSICLFLNLSEIGNEDCLTGYTV